LQTVSYSELLRRNRDFRLLWGGQIVSQLGDWFSLITLQSLLLTLTGSASAVAALMVAQMLPQFLLSPVAGVVVDRLPRKRVMIAADLGRTVIALGFLLVHNRSTAWLAYGFYALLSSLTVFFEPARQAVIPAITRREELVTANALGAVTWSVLLTSGALVGGIVTQYFGRDVAFVLNSLSFAGSALFIRGIDVPRTAPGRHGGFGDLIAGFRYVAGRGELMALLSVKAAWGLTGGVGVLVTLFGQKLFPLAPGKGPLSISLLTAASGVGTALGPVIGRRVAGSDMRRMYWALAAGYLVGGACFVALGYSWSLASAGAALFVGRMGGSLLWVFSTVLLQRTSEDRFRGRVFAAEGALCTLTMAISSFGVGAVVDYGVSAFTVARALGLIALVTGAGWCVGLRFSHRCEPDAAHGDASAASSEDGSSGAEAGSSPISTHGDA
jgi:Major Facilitator Superfamily